MWTDQTDCNIKLNRENIEKVKKKKLLGITIAGDLKFEDHITARKLKVFKTINDVDIFVQDNHGCSQDTCL